jgi:hypothetical protein
MLRRYHLIIPLIIPCLLFLLCGRDALAQAARAKAKRLGNLELSISKAESMIMVADGYGSSSSSIIAEVDFRIRNVGGVPICVQFAPTIEEYKSSETRGVEPVKRVFPDHEIDRLPPGKESVGHLSFRIPFSRRTYALALQQLSGSRDCAQGAHKNEGLLRGGTTVRLPLPEISR